MLDVGAVQLIRVFLLSQSHKSTIKADRWTCHLKAQCARPAGDSHLPRPRDGGLGKCELDPKLRPLKG